MEITSFGLASKAATELKRIRKDMGSNVKRSYGNVKERLDQVEKDIEAAYKLTDDIIISNAINIAKAEGRINAIAKIAQNDFQSAIFDDLYDASNINTANSISYTHNTEEGYIDSTADNCMIETQPINIGTTASKLILVEGAANKDWGIVFQGKGGPSYGQQTQYKITDKITLQAKVRIDVIKASNIYILANLQNKGFGLRINSGKVGAYTYVNGTAITPMSTQAFSVGDIVTVTYTFDGTTSRLYVNGVLDSEQTKAGALYAADQPLVFGYNPPTTTDETGKFTLYEVRVFHECKTADNILENLDDLKDKENLVLWVKPELGGFKDISPYHVTPTLSSNFVNTFKDDTNTVNLYRNKAYISFDDTNWTEVKKEELIKIDKLNTTGNIKIKFPMSENARMSYYSVIWS